MGILRIFPHLQIFFPVLPIFRISADFHSFELSALSTLLSERERNTEKNAYKITLTEPQREMRKIAHKNIPNRASAPQTSKQCAVHTFILLTSGILNGSSLVWGMHFLHRCYFLLEVAR